MVMVDFVLGFFFLPLLTAVQEADDAKSVTQAKMFAAAIISTGLTFRSVQELFLRAHMEMPLREDQFSRYQREFATYIARYTAVWCRNMI